MTNTSDIPGPPARFLLGNLPEFKHNPLACVLNWQRDYGDIVHFKLGPRDFYLISHPELAEQALVQQQDTFIKMYDADRPNGLALILGQGLVTSSGELWRKQRRLMQPVFNRSSVVTMLPEMIQTFEKLNTRWCELPAGVAVNVADEMMRLTIEVITQTMFSTSVLGRIDQIGPALDIGLRFAAKSIMNPLRAPLWLPTRANREFINARNFLNDTIDVIISERRQDSGQYHDLLQMLLEAQDPETGEKMHDRQIRDEVLTIFSAGHETTATALSWTLALLANHPEILARLREEVAGVLNGKTPEIQDLSQLSYTRAVLEESMRIRPPVSMVMRKIATEANLQGYRLKAGGFAIFSIYNMHHHADFWVQPEVFDPERFLSAEKRNKAYMPFGIGHRFCVGNNFALIESQVLLALMVQHFDFELVNAQLPDMEMVVTLKPKDGLPMLIRSRCYD